MLLSGDVDRSIGDRSMSGPNGPGAGPSFRWTPDGGSIGVALDAANGTVRVDVTDTGPGISREDALQIFSPFVSRDTQGTGLGLPIARELAGALGGRVELRSEPGRGSTFRLVLPARTI